MIESQKPQGFASLAELIAAIMAHERTRRREASEMPWPPRNEQRVMPVYGLLVRK